MIFIVLFALIAFAIYMMRRNAKIAEEVRRMSVALRRRLSTVIKKSDEEKSLHKHEHVHEDSVVSERGTDRKSIFGYDFKQDLDRNPRGRAVTLKQTKVVVHENTEEHDDEVHEFQP